MSRYPRNKKKRLALAVAACALATPVLAAPALEEIIVTAQHQAESIQSAGIAVSALSGEALTKAGVTTSEDLMTLVPALIVQPAAGPSTQFYIRGVGSFSANAYAENAVGFQVDGVYFARIGAPNGVFYDLERVEVLKGPQGTLYGRHAACRAVHQTRRLPQ